MWKVWWFSINSCGWNSGLPFPGKYMVSSLRIKVVSGMVKRHWKIASGWSNASLRILVTEMSKSPSRSIVKVVVSPRWSLLKNIAKNRHQLSIRITLQIMQKAKNIFGLQQGKKYLNFRAKNICNIHTLVPTRVGVQVWDKLQRLNMSSWYGCYPVWYRSNSHPKVELQKKTKSMRGDLG